MSSVPKSKRNKSKFEVTDNLANMNKAITNLVLHNFGFSEKKFQKQIDYHERQLRENNVDEEEIEVFIQEFTKKKTMISDWYLENLRNSVMEILDDINLEFTKGNSIYPSGEALIEEYKQRRSHMDEAIGGCYALKNKLEMIVDTLPIDANKIVQPISMLKKEIDLIKGVRQADNRFLRQKNINKNKNEDSENKEDLNKKSTENKESISNE